MNNSTRLIAFDLDGTTLNEQGEINDFTVQALEKASREGNSIVVATGRPLAIVPRFVKELPFLNYLITSGGAVVEDAKTGEKLAVRPLDTQLAQKITLLAKANKAAVNLSCLEKHYLDITGLKIITRRKKKLPFKKPSFKNLQDLSRNSVLTWDALRTMKQQKSVLKLECLYPTEAVFLRHVKALGHIQEIELAPGMGCTMEITAQGVNKGTAIELLGNHLGIAKAQRIVFGDSGNDIPMRKTAGIFVAVENAAEDVKEIADVVTESVEQDGVGKALYTLLWN